MKTNTTTSELKVNGITKETEKAICVNVAVSWGEGSWRMKDVWFPKSTAEVVEVNGETHVMVADWMLQKTAEQNAFHGYRMNFCECFNSHFC